MRRFTIALALLSAVSVSQATAQSVSPVQRVVPSVDLQAPRIDAPITPLDRIEVKVFREPDLSVEDVPVDESGRISLPLLGSLTASGKSPDVLATELTAKLGRYLRNPQVAVLVKQAASRRITVTGSVEAPGVYPLEGRLSLLQAVALAKGPSQVASLNQAMIFRVRDGQRIAARYDLNAIAKGTAADPEVISGDTVAIGSSRMKTAWRDMVLSLRSFNVFSLVP